MRLTNIIQQLTLAVAFTLVSFTVTAQERPNDEILLVVNDGSIAIDDQYESCGLLLKDSSEDIPHYYLYTSKNYAKHKFGENRGELSDWIYVYTVKDGKLAIYKKKSPDNKFSGIFLDAKREKVDPNPNAKTAIDQNIIIGVVPELGVGEFYFSKKSEAAATPVMRLTIYRASEFQDAESLNDSTILSVRYGLATRKRGDDGIEVITLSDKSAIDTLDIKIPANTILREVKIGDSVRQSYIPTETFANEFEKERSKPLCLETSDIGSLLAGNPLTLTYVAFDENGALNQSISLTYKFTYTEPAPVLLWWHYLVAALILVAILATIGALIWRKRVKSKKEREEHEEQREREEKEEREEKRGEKEKKKHHDDDDDKENQEGDENKESTSGDSATKSDDLEELKRKLDEAEAKLQELERVQSDLDVSQQRVEELNGTIKAKDDEIKRLEGELSAKSRELEKSQRDLEAARKALETLEREIDEKVKKAVEEKEAAHNEEVKCLNEEHQEAIDAKESEITGLNTKHALAIAEEQAKYDNLKEQYDAVTNHWRRDREQILPFLSSQFKFIDGDIANILGKADPSSPISEILKQLRDSEYGYEAFKEDINKILKREDRTIEELIADIRAFVMTNMRAHMSWINNAARLTAYASTKEFKLVFGHYKDAAEDTKHLFEQIEILLAMWGITSIYIPKLLSTKYNENEHDYCNSTLVLPSIFPDYTEHTGNMVIYDFLQVGYMANGEKVKAVIAY